MIFVTDAHIRQYIKDERLAALIEGDTGILDQAELTAISIIRQAVGTRYNVDDVLIGDPFTERLQFFVRWICVIMLYLLYERLPERMAPERVTKNYEEVLGWLKDLATGKVDNSVLQPTDANNDGVADQSRFRWGSRTPRSH